MTTQSPTALQVPAAMAARVSALRFSLETDLAVSFAYPKGEPVTVLVTPWGRDAYFSLGTLESFVAGCEAAIEDALRDPAE